MKNLALLLLVGCPSEPTEVPVEADADTDADSDADADADTDADSDTDTDADTDTACSYPLGAVEPMAEDEVLTAYSWPDARHLDGRTGDLDLDDVPCDTDPDIDWSPHDVLLFVSIPAW